MKRAIAALALIAVMPSQAHAWGKDAYTRTSIIIASTVFVSSGNCPGWKVNSQSVMQAVRANGYLPEEVLEQPLEAGIRQWMAIYKGSDRRDACGGILMSFGPKGGHIAGLVVRKR